MFKKNKIKKILFLVFFIFLFTIVTQIVIVAIESSTPSFKSPVKTITDLIPANSKSWILLNNLEKDSLFLRNHQLYKKFKTLKMTEELFLSQEINSIIDNVEKYSGIKFDEDLFFRFFGQEGAICKIDKSILVIAKVDRITLFLKQVAKTLTEYQVLKESIKTEDYNGIAIEKLTKNKKDLYFTFIQNYAFYSDDDEKIKNIIDLAKGNKYQALSDNQDIMSAITKDSKIYPIVLYNKSKDDKELKSVKGKDRFNKLFTYKIGTVALQNNIIKLNYQYFYSDYGKKGQLTQIIDKDKKSLEVMKGFPKATAFYITSSQLNSGKLYDWINKTWLLDDKEQKQFNKIYDKVEEHFKVEIRRLVQEEFGNEVALLWTGLGYQGYNPFPKLALVVKVGEYAKPIEKMKRIFKYAFNYHALKETKLHGTSVYYFKSNLRIGYEYYTSNRDTTSKYKDFSPSFAYLNDYLVVAFNQNTINAVIAYLKGQEGIKSLPNHESLWKLSIEKYPVKYFVNPDRVKELATTYLKYLANNEPDEFLYSDAKNRLTPLVELLEEVDGVGGGFDILDDQIKGEIVINLK